MRTPTASVASSYVVFQLGGEGYALEVMRVQEVKDMQALTEVPGGPKSLLGVINLRGHVVPVYDLRMPFGLSKENKAARAPCVLIVESTMGNDVTDHRPPGGPGFRRARVFPRGSASRTPAWTWEGDPLRARLDPSPRCLLARIGRRSYLLDPRVAER